MTKYLHYNTVTGIFLELDTISDRPELILIDENKIYVNVIHGFIHQMIKKYGNQILDTDTIKQEWLNFKK